jgi:hypothetical protein
MGLQLQQKSAVITKVILSMAVVSSLLTPSFVGILSGKSALAQVATPNLSLIKFINTQKYARENNAADLDAQLTTYAATQSVKFYVDGKMDSPIVGSYFSPTGTKYEQWRLYTELNAGQHVITADVEINNTWYTASGSSTVFVLDMPTTSYVFPVSGQNTFRPSDNPLRIKVDDEFNQFKQAKFSLYSYDSVKNKFGKHLGTFALDRSRCDLRAAGNYLFCNLSDADAWTDLSEGTYAVKLFTNTSAGNGIRTSLADYWSQPFIVDGHGVCTGERCKRGREC